MNVVDLNEDAHGQYATVWECEPPAVGVRFKVTDDYWTDDCRVRHVREWIACP